MTTQTGDATDRSTRAPGGRDAAVKDYMQRFAAALSQGDGKTIATMWHVPSLVVADQMVRAVSSRDEVEAFFSGAKEQYHARGIREARPDIQSIDWVTDRLALVRVRWPYIDASNAEIGEESSTYTLRRGDGGELQVVAVVMHGEKPRG